MTRLRLLGGVSLQQDSGAAITMPGPKVRALVSYLALQRGQFQQRDKLATLLWPQAPHRRARHNLRQLLLVVRDALPPPVVKEIGETIAFDLGEMEVDAVEFERLAATGVPEMLTQAAELYQGDLLAGLGQQSADYEEWLVSERERLRELAQDAFARLLAHHLRANAVEPAIHSAMRLLTLDPTQEAVHRTLMRLYTRQGRRGAALRQYQACVAALQQELGIEPELGTKQLYQEILRRRAPAPAVVTGQTPSPHQVPAPELPAPDTPLIGRDAEAAALGAALEAALGGRGRVALLLGETGVGKTRLLAEVAEPAVARGARMLVGRCYESAQILPLGPWVQALRTGRVLDQTDVIDDLGDVWRGELARLLPEVMEHRAPGGARGEDYLRLFEALVRLVVGLAGPKGLVLALEDIHWADEMSLRFLALLGHRVAAHPILVVATAREEELEESPALGRTLGELRGEATTLVLTLGRLSREAMASLVTTLGRAGQDVTAADTLTDRIWQASEGNPFIAVETLRAHEQGALPMGGTLPLPERVRDVIAQRLGRLGACPRGLANVAAVIGREFEFAVLHRAAGLSEREAAAAMEELVRRRVLHGVGERFDFTHDRIRDVVYGQLLGPSRKLLHAAVGRALEELYAANLEPHYAALGLHYREGEVWDKAQRYLRHAGAQAAARSALQEARALLEQALGALEALPDCASTLEQAFDARLELRPVLTQLGDIGSALERLREAETLAERLNDDRRQGRVAAFMTHIHSTFGQLDAALVAGGRAVQSAERLGDARLRILATTYLEQAHYYRGDYEQVVTLATENLAALPAEWLYDYFGNAAPASIYDRIWLVLTLAQLGRFAEAAEHETEMIRLAEPTQHAFTVGLAHFAAGTLHLLKGDSTRARSMLERGTTEIRVGNVVLLLSYALTASAWLLAQLGEASEAASRFREGEQRLERETARGPVGHRGWAYCSLGRAALLLGRLDDARRVAHRVVESFPAHFGFVAHALHLLGDVETHADPFDAESGEAHYRQALALAQPRGMRPLVAHCHLGLGRMYRRRGERATAQDHLATATAMCHEMDMRFWLEQGEAAAQ